MGVEGCTKCIKYMLFVLNFIFWVSESWNFIPVFSRSCFAPCAQCRLRLTSPPIPLYERSKPIAFHFLAVLRKKKEQPSSFFNVLVELTLLFSPGPHIMANLGLLEETHGGNGNLRNRTEIPR